MPQIAPLSDEYFDRPVTIVARNLLGMLLVRQLGEDLLAGYITETEAYDGSSDLACHARVGKTARNAVMYGPAGNAYVYFTYGMHWCLNVVTGPVDYPAAVLIRAIFPVKGLSRIAYNRQGVKTKQWSNGPAKLTKALEINGEQNGIKLTGTQSGLWIEKGIEVADQYIQTGKRIGIDRTPEPWRSKPWRFWLGNGTAVELFS